MFRPCFLAFLSLVSGSQTGASAALESLSGLRSIDRVPESLKALLSGLEEESTDRMKVFNEQKQWCDKTLYDKEQAIKDAKDAIEEHTADLQDAESRRDTANQRADGIKGKIRAADAELSEVEKKFDEEKAAFKSKVEDLQEATGDVEQAVFTHRATVRRQGDKLAELKSLDNALLKDSAPSFLQTRAMNADDEAEDRAAKVQSAKDMEEAEAQLREEWGEKQKEMGELLKQKKDEIAQLESDLESANLAVAEAEESVASLTRSRSAAERTQAREDTLLNSLKAGCEQFQGFVKSQDKIRVDAAAALDEAVDLVQQLQHTALQSFVQAPSFVQISYPAAMLDLSTAADAQAAVSEAEGLDPLASIKAKIQGMVQALEAAANAETGPANFCSDEQSKNREKKRTKTDDIDRLAAEARKKGFDLDGLIAEQRAAQNGINSLSVLKAHMENFASVEQSRLGSMKKDHDLAVEVLDKAASLVKSEFGLSLLQGQALSPQEAAAKAVSAMQTANEKIRDLSAGYDSYLSKLESGGQETLVEVGRCLRSEEEELAAAKTAEATTRDEVAQAQESEQAARAELTVIETYLTNLGQQCGPQLGNSYEELKRQREEEIAALQDALKVLEGESVPALSMAQVKNPTAVQRAAIALGVA